MSGQSASAKARGKVVGKVVSSFNRTKDMKPPRLIANRNIRGSQVTKALRTKMGPGPQKGYEGPPVKHPGPLPAKYDVPARETVGCVLW